MNAEDLLKAELGQELFASIGGRSDGLAAMKARLHHRRRSKHSSSHEEKKRFRILHCDEEETRWKMAILNAARDYLDNDQIVAIRCRREAAENGWAALLKLYKAKIKIECNRENAHASIGGFVAMSGPIAWCLGGWQSQRAVQDAAATVVAEAKRRAMEGRRDFFVVRPIPTFGKDEMTARLDHLFTTIPDRHLLQLDEEAAYSVSNETTAAKISTICAECKPTTIIDATACVGGNTVAFARRFDHVIAFEIDAEKIRMLKHNLTHVRQHLSITQVQIHHGDCLELLPNILTKVTAPVLVFADPPWGGRNYKFQAKPDVHLKTQQAASTLHSLLNIVASHSAVTHLALKLPFNFDSASLVSTISSKLQTHQIYALSTKVQLLLFTFLRSSSLPPALSSGSDRNKRVREKNNENHLLLGNGQSSLSSSPPHKVVLKKKRKKSLSSLSSP
uniref:Trimethylguanosine synthase n=1 Tax=Aureoumbra lagunensis TaxID=44058 RepID=A0A7S3JZT5_9STRA